MTPAMVLLKYLDWVQHCIDWRDVTVSVIPPDVPYVELTPFRPKKKRASYIGPRILRITEGRGLVPWQSDKIQRNANPIWEDYEKHAEVRRTATKGSEGTGFHQDGDTSDPNNMDFAIVLWADRDATEFQVEPGGPIVQAKANTLIIFRNLAVYHRRPPYVEGKRWSFRQRVEIPEWL